MTSIDELYHVFARYRVERPVEGCPHCTSDADDKLLRSKPLQTLAGSDLSRIAFKAMTTLGTVEDFKHFLPRILELVAQRDEIGDTDVEVALSKLDYGKWHYWPGAERDAVERYLNESWVARLAAYTDSAQIDRYLCGLARAGVQIERYLDLWRKTPGLPPSLHLATVIGENYTSVLKYGHVGNAYWDSPEARSVYTDWLISAETKSQLEGAFFQIDAKSDNSEEITTCLSEAVTHLEWLLVSMGRAFG